MHIGESEALKASEEKFLAAEKYTSVIRSLVVAFNTVIYFTVLPEPQKNETLAYSVLIIAWLYVLCVLIFKPYKLFKFIYSNYTTYLFDAVLIILWIKSTGSYFSPFYLLWHVSIIAVAFRFNMAITLLTCSIYSILYLGVIYLDHSFVNLEKSVLLTRVGYIFLSGGMAGLVTRETLEQTRQKHEMQRLAEDARRSEDKLKMQTLLYENLINVQGEMGEGVIITEKDRIIFVNEAVSRLYGYKQPELSELPSIQELFSRTEKGRIKDLVEKNESGRGETLMVKKTGEFIFVNFSFKKIIESDTTRVFFLFRDVTDSKRAEADLVQRTLDLERSKALQSKRDEFISIASHELKTPLTSIKAYVQLIERTIDIDGQTQGPVIGTYVKKASVQVDKLTMLIADLLDVSKIQAGKLLFNFSRFNFGDLVRECIESVQHTSRSHTIVLKENTDVNVIGDKQRLEQVFENFLSNAIKYSPKADLVEVTVTADNAFVTVCVKDFGIGISESNLRKIFDRFYRVDESSRKFSGLGIGLYISNQIISRHQGKVWVDSEYGKGSEFYFKIPINQNTLE